MNTKSELQTYSLAYLRRRREIDALIASFGGPRIMTTHHLPKLSDSLLLCLFERKKDGNNVRKKRKKEGRQKEFFPPFGSFYTTFAKKTR